MSCKEGSCSCSNGDQGRASRHSALIRISGDPAGPLVISAGKGLKIEDPLVQVRFKGNRKEYFRSAFSMSPDTGDLVIVETDGGYDLGCVTLTGDRALEAFRRGRMVLDPNHGRILRKADDSDIRNWLRLKRREREALTRLRKLSGMIDPDMEIRDVEFRSDGRKLRIFYRKGDRDSVQRMARETGSIFGMPAEMVNRDIPGNSPLRNSGDVRHPGWNKPSQAQGPFSPH